MDRGTLVCLCVGYPARLFFCIATLLPPLGVRWGGQLGGSGGVSLSGLPLEGLWQDCLKGSFFFKIEGKAVGCLIDVFRLPLLKLALLSALLE